MRSTILKASFLIIVAILSSVVAKHVYSRQLSTAALTATTTESYFRYPTGEYVRSEQRTLFVRGDGSSVELKRGVAPDGRPVEKRILVDITARKRVVIDGMTDSITTYPLRESQALKAAQRMQRCASGLNPERRVLLGYDVEFVHAEYSVPGVEFRVVDAWEAPTLNCLALKQLIKSGSSRDALVTTNIIEVNSVQLGEPDASLFAVPVGYEERAPSAVFNEYYRRYPGAGRKPNPHGSGATAQDQAYYSHNRQK